jgi:hypothetical protein
MATVAPDISPTSLLDRFRGEVFSSRPGYPEVLLLKVRDGDGSEWWFSTFYATFSPSDPDVFLGKVVIATEVEPGADGTVHFSDGSRLEIHRFPREPGDEEPDDDLETWSLITPEGIVLDHGPGGKWTLDSLGHPLGENPARRR